jgi:hypothetical protein
LGSILPVIRETQPVIRTEVFKKLSAAQRYALHDLLTENGYKVFLYGGAATPRGELLERRSMTRARHFDVLAVPQHRLERGCAA